MPIGPVLRRACFGLAVTVAVGGLGATRHVVEHHRVLTSGDPALIQLWSAGAAPVQPGGKRIEPTSKQYGGGWFLMAVGAGVAAALALPARAVRAGAAA